jgi:hypothetical protein
LLSLARLLSFCSIALLVLLVCYLIQILAFTIWTKNLRFLAGFGIFACALVVAVASLGVSLSITYVSGL